MVSRRIKRPAHSKERRYRLELMKHFRATGRTSLLRRAQQAAVAWRCAGYP